MTDLTKWPLLLVVGDAVTEQQANEILIRTDSWSLMTNDRDWERQICRLLGVKQGEYGGPDLRALDSLLKELGVLGLHYLHTSRIVSSWIGGPHGWCNWDGTIGSSNYNIGKWPDVEDVTEDWSRIAEAFPFLDLRAQVIPDEGEAGFVAAEWRVKDGRVEVVNGRGPLLCRPKDPIMWNLFNSGRERGVSLDRLSVAIEQVRAGRIVQDVPEVTE